MIKLDKYISTIKISTRFLSNTYFLFYMWRICLIYSLVPFSLKLIFQTTIIKSILNQDIIKDYFQDSRIFIWITNYVIWTFKYSKYFKWVMNQILCPYIRKFIVNYFWWYSYLFIVASNFIILNIWELSYLW